MFRGAWWRRSRSEGGVGRPPGRKEGHVARILRSSGLVAIALGLVLTPGRAAGQEQPKSGLIGRVHDDPSGEVGPAAGVFIDGQPSKATLSSPARFVLTNLT